MLVLYVTLHHYMIGIAKVNMYLLLIMFVNVYGQCIVQEPDILWCKEISTFNLNGSNVVYLDIEDSSITSLPMFTRDAWPRFFLLCETTPDFSVMK